MKKPFMEVIRFDSSDVILTSGGHSVNGLYVYCPAGHNEYGETHFHLEGIYSSMPYANGHKYENGGGSNVCDFPLDTFKDGLPTQEDIGNWYYYNSDYQFELCNSGK